MSIKTIAQSVNVWKLAILKVSLMAFVAGATSFQTSMNGLKWELLSWGDRFYILLGSVVVIANVIIAFIDQTMARIGSEQKVLASDLEPPTAPPPHPGAASVTFVPSNPSTPPPASPAANPDSQVNEHP